MTVGDDLKITKAMIGAIVLTLIAHVACYAFFFSIIQYWNAIIIDFVMIGIISILGIFFAGE